MKRGSKPFPCGSNRRTIRPVQLWTYSHEKTCYRMHPFEWLWHQLDSAWTQG